MGVWNSAKCYFSNAVDSYWRRCNKLIALSAVPYLLNASSGLGFLSSVLKKHLSTVSDFFFLPLAYRCFKNYFHRLRFSSRTWFVHKKFFWKCMCVCLYTLCLCKIWWGRLKFYRLACETPWTYDETRREKIFCLKIVVINCSWDCVGFFFSLVGVENAYLLKISVNPPTPLPFLEHYFLEKVFKQATYFIVWQLIISTTKIVSLETH